MPTRMDLLSSVSDGPYDGSSGRSRRGAGARPPERAWAATSDQSISDVAASPTDAGGKALRPYAPLNVLKPVIRDVWIVDGPIVRMAALGVGIPFTTRMTVLRLDAGLLLHSPTPLSPDLTHELARLGQVRWLVAPNRLHRTWIEPWAAAFPEAEVFLAPRARLPQGAERRALRLGRRDGYPWDAELRTLPVRGHYMTEVVFFHIASRTLVLTDLFENVEPRRVGSPWLRWLMRIGGVAAPHGGLPRDLRATFPRAGLKLAVEEMIAWNPERILLAHGQWIDRGGAAALATAFRWLLGPRAPPGG